MTLYKIGGLGADEKVFEKLTLNTPSVSIKWLAAVKNESLQDYVIRLSNQIDQSKEFGLIGVSFGGVIAIELSKIVNPKTVILVSSVSKSDELPYQSMRLILSNLIKLIPYQLIKPPQFIMYYMFGAIDKDLLSRIISDTDPKFIKWALDKILNWDYNGEVEDILRIHGSKDRLIPIIGKAHMVQNGGHFMIVDKASQISLLINEFIDGKLVDE